MTNFFEYIPLSKAVWLCLSWYMGFGQPCLSGKSEPLFCGRKQKMKKLLCVLATVLLTINCFSSTKYYPNVEVSKLIKVIDGDTFKCDIEVYPAIIGENISIRIRNLDTSELRSKNSQEKLSAIQEKERLIKILATAKKIELKNLSRDKYFRIVADVYIDNKPLLKFVNPKFLSNLN